MLKSGDTFLLPKTSAAIEHLWVVLTDPDLDQLAVCVNITTSQGHSDTIVVLKPGDHSFIKKESVVHYPDAQLLNLKSVQAALDAKAKSFVCTQHDPCSAKLLKRIRDGLLKSPHAPNGLKQRCRAIWQSTRL